MERTQSDRIAWLAGSVLPHEPALRRWLQRRARFGVLGLSVDDIVQEAYAKLSGLPSVDHILNPRSYFFSTAHSILLQEIRRQKVVPIDAIEAGESFDVAGPEPSPDQLFEAREELMMVIETINSLPEKCRQVFILRKIHGLSQRDIAARLGIAESTVEKHLARGIRKLMDTHRYGGIETRAASYENELGVSLNDCRAPRKRHR